MAVRLKHKLHLRVRVRASPALLFAPPPSFACLVKSAQVASCRLCSYLTSPCFVLLGSQACFLPLVHVNVQSW